MFDNNENGVVETRLEFVTIDGETVTVYEIDNDEDNIFDDIAIDFNLDGKIDVIEPKTN